MAEWKERLPHSVSEVARPAAPPGRMHHYRGGRGFDAVS